MSTYSAVVPCYNEEDNVRIAYERIRAVLESLGDFEILFVDDGSRDQTLAIVKDLAKQDERVRYLSFSRNYGLEAAFSAGFRYASKEWVIQFDADLQSPPEEAVKLVNKAKEGYDAVFAVRRTRQDPLARRLGSAAQRAFATRVLGIEMPLGASVFRIVRTAVAKKVLGLSFGTRYFLAMLPRVTNSYATVATEHGARKEGGSRWRFTKLLTHSAELFYGYSRVPLTVAVGLLGIAVTLAAAGFLTATLSVGLLGGLISAPYLRILQKDTRDKRLYFIREANLAVEPTDDLYEFQERTGS